MLSRSISRSKYVPRTKRSSKLTKNIMEAGCIGTCIWMGTKKGPWTPEEDEILVSHIRRYGYDNWCALPKQADWETKQLKKLEAADDHHKYYSSHQAVESVGNINISTKEFFDSFSRSHSSALTATLTQPTHMINASRNTPEIYKISPSLIKSHPKEPPFSSAIPKTSSHCEPKLSGHQYGHTIKSLSSSFTISDTSTTFPPAPVSSSMLTLEKSRSSSTKKSSPAVKKSSEKGWWELKPTPPSPMITSLEVSIFGLECFLLMGCDGKAEEIKKEAELAALVWRNKLMAEGGL
ncbi:hypothetical protein LguiB_035615 [Lonicera macranthoides]